MILIIPLMTVSEGVYFLMCRHAFVKCTCPLAYPRSETELLCWQKLHFLCPALRNYIGLVGLRLGMNCRKGDRDLLLCFSHVFFLNLSLKNIHRISDCRDMNYLFSDVFLQSQSISEPKVFHISFDNTKKVFLYKALLSD